MNKTMVDLQKLKPHIWVFPFLAGIFGILAVSIPVAQNYDLANNDNVIFWYFPFNIDFFENDIFINTRPLPLIGGILEMVILIIGSVILLLTSLLVWKKKWNLKFIRIFWLISIIILVFVPTALWIIGALT